MTQTIPLFERLEIETISTCNRSCWFCPRTYDRSGKYFDAEGREVSGRMPTERVIELLDQAETMSFERLVAFYYYSEPLLDKRHAMFAREARSRRMRPYLHTNGDLLRRDDALCETVQELYEFIVVGLYDYETEDERSQAEQYWRQRLGRAELMFNPIGRKGAESSCRRGVPRALVPHDIPFGAPQFVYRNAPCHRPLIRLIVHHDGTMAHCCEDITGAFGLGNVDGAGIEELWFSDRHVQVVQDLIAGRREKYDLCRDCPMPPTATVTRGRVDIARRRGSGGRPS